VWASLVPAKKAGQPMPRWVTQDTFPVSAISLERCPPSAWNGVRHHSGMLSAISAERCPGWRGIRTYDGHTVGSQLEQVSILTGQAPKIVLADRGYRGVEPPEGTRLLISHTRRLPKRLKKLLSVGRL